MSIFARQPGLDPPTSATANGTAARPPTRLGDRTAIATLHPAGTAPAGGPAPPGCGAPAAAAAAAAVDARLDTAVRQSAHLRRGFYIVVLLVALAGQVTGAVQTLHVPLPLAVPAVAALELGGVVVFANADVRRRLGERALGSRILSAAIAAGAVTFNWLAHPDWLAGGFFAGMSLLGYLVWLTHAENSRRDRLRAVGLLPPTTPAYEIVGHWLRHPWRTRRARSLASVDATLGLYGSLAAAHEQARTDRRRTAIAKVLHRKIRAAVDPDTADIAVAVYDLDVIAGRLADHADYDGLTALIAGDLTPARLTANPAGTPSRATPSRATPSRATPSRATPAARSDRSWWRPHATGTIRWAPIAAPPAHDATPCPTGTHAAGEPAVGTAATAPPAWPRGATPPARAEPDGTDAHATRRVRDDHHARPGDATDHRDSKSEPEPGDATRPEKAINEHTNLTNLSTQATDGGNTDGANTDGNLVPRETAAAVAYWYHREPALRPQEIAARIGRSERTVRRHWPPTARAGGLRPTGGATAGRPPHAQQQPSRLLGER